MFDTTNLKEVPVRSKARDGWRGSRFYDADSVLVAKTCTHCREALGIREFSKNKKMPDGLQFCCKTCASLERSVYRGKQKAADPDYWRESHDKTMGRRRARTQQAIQKDRDRLRPNGTKRCRSCLLVQPLSTFYQNISEPDGLSKECSDCDKEKRRQRYKKHWASKGIPFDQCIYCQMMTDLTPGDLHGDHVVARAIGGPDDMSNTAPACYACNICKGEDTLEKFLAEQFFYEEDRQEILDRLRQYGYVA